MEISVDELAKDTDKYVKMAQDEEIIIVDNGTPTAKLVSAENPKMRALRSLIGILPSDLDVDALRMERILK